MTRLRLGDIISMDIAVIEQRILAIKASLKTIKPEGWSFHKENVHGAVQGTLSILSLIYGPNSLQVSQFQSRIKVGQDRGDDRGNHYEHRVADDVFSALDSAVADAKSGLALPERTRGKGEILGDFVVAGRATLESTTSGTEKVAAVLVAAALEETLKQIAETSGIDVYDRDMRGVIQKLKDADILVGPQAALAFGYSQFRDRAFHAQFDQIERGTIDSALVFVEGLVQQHFI